MHSHILTIIHIACNMSILIMLQWEDVTKKLAKAFITLEFISTLMFLVGRQVKL